jgi:hypothetical protein
LKAEGLLAKARYKDHHYRISEVLKRYLGRRFQFDALESTSAEVLQSLSRFDSLDARVVERVRTLFDALDRVKFTDHIPSQAEAERALEEAQELVRLTRRTPVPPIPEEKP